MPDITVRLSGGLGNQLFQLFAALYVANKYPAIRSDILLETGYLKSYSTLRAYEASFVASCFPNVSEGVDPSLVSKFAIACRLGRLVDGRLFGRDFLSTTNALLSATTTPKHVLLDGYFIAPEVCPPESTRVRIRDKLFESRSGLLARFIGDKRVYAVHIRRGDYVSSRSAAKKYRAIPLEFYRAALAMLPRADRVLVFSDDASIAASFSQECGAVNMASHSLTLSDEFVLMAACSSYIIANSTFSWWASVIGGRGDKACVAPEEWFYSRRLSVENPLLVPGIKTVRL
jgi:hypothetical protein